MCILALARSGGISDADADTVPQHACEEAGRAAEQAGALPANMLVSIGLVESGRVDPATRQAAAWPWTVNVDGTGHYFQDEQAAAAFAGLAESSGARDVDVGCFQISLESHPNAFASMDIAFDPAANANFAAQFLNRLKSEAGSWNSAIADYHSSLPQLGLPYQRLVLDRWQGFGNMPLGLEAGGYVQADPVIIMEAPAARLVRVITMDDGPERPASGLPRVITP